MIDSINFRLFSATPRDTLYHYTSLSGLLGIIGGQHLRASDVRFMNDSTELRHTLTLLQDHLEQRLRAGTDHPTLLDDMRHWLGRRVSGGPLLFAASFRANGNLLSQWRGYSVHGKGVSLGFAPRTIADCADRQGFQVGRCIYDADEQLQLIEEIVDAVERLAADNDPEATGSESVFESIEDDLLRIAALLKHPAFEEEDEWRVISPSIADVGHPSISFREGHSMLVPYYRFDLSEPSGHAPKLEHVWLGPTANQDLSMMSLARYLDSQGCRPRSGIYYCQIPQRPR